MNINQEISDALTKTLNTNLNIDPENLLTPDLGKDKRKRNTNSNKLMEGHFHVMGYDFKVVLLSAPDNQQKLLIRTKNKDQKGKVKPIEKRIVDHGNLDKELKEPSQRVIDKIRKMAFPTEKDQEEERAWYKRVHKAILDFLPEFNNKEKDAINKHLINRRGLGDHDDEHWGPMAAEVIAKLGRQRVTDKRLLADLKELRYAKGPYSAKFGRNYNPHHHHLTRAATLMAKESNALGDDMKTIFSVTEKPREVAYIIDALIFCIPSLLDIEKKKKQKREKHAAAVKKNKRQEKEKAAEKEKEKEKPPASENSAEEPQPSVTAESDRNNVERSGTFDTVPTEQSTVSIK